MDHLNEEQKNNEQNNKEPEYDVQKNLRKEFGRGIVLGILSCLMVVMLLILGLEKAGVLNMGLLTSGYAINKYNDLEEEILDKIDVLEAYIDKFYLDDIDKEKMADSVYKGVIDGLGDKYAAYYTEEEYKTIVESTSGSYCGIGAYISTDAKTGMVSIVEPMKGSPCEKAGAKAGDLIYEVDGKDVSKMELSQVQALVKGKKGSKVKLTLIREGKKVEVTVTRDEIDVDTVAYQMLPGDIGYIQVSSFEEITATQFRKAVDSLEKDGEKGLIIDLRNNGGGVLDTAVDMLDRLLPKGLVVYSMDKDGNRKDYAATDDDEFQKPLVILVNENSASASEVFSGAIQDLKKGTLIGTTTFGKGIVQGIFSLKDGSALKMTMARYYTPLGRNIHGKGLEPDVKVELSEDIETLSDGKTKVDNQLKEAIDYLEALF